MEFIISTNKLRLPLTRKHIFIQDNIFSVETPKQCAIFFLIIALKILLCGDTFIIISCLKSILCLNL